MVTQSFQAALNATCQRILEDVELAVPAEKFPLLRKRILNAFGEKGLAKTLGTLPSGSRQGDGRE